MFLFTMISLELTAGNKNMVLPDEVLIIPQSKSFLAGHLKKNTTIFKLSHVVGQRHNKICNMSKVHFYFKVAQEVISSKKRPKPSNVTDPHLQGGIHGAEPEVQTSQPGSGLP